MDTLDSFYVTLPSNASVQIHPNNNLAEHTVVLPRRLELKGEWLCALSEIHFHVSHFNLSDGQYFQVVAMSGSGEEGVYTDVGEGPMEVPAGYYRDPSILLQKMTEVWSTHWNSVKNALSKTKNLPVERPMVARTEVAAGRRLTHAERRTMKRIDQSRVPDVTEKSLAIYFNEQNRLATFILNSESYLLKLSSELAYILGIREEDFTIQGEGSAAVSAVYISSLPVDLSKGLRRLFVYCSAIAENIVGDRLAPLLRVITIEGLPVGPHSQVFSRLQYYPVKTNIIESIEVNLRTETGELLESNWGHSCTVLHFKRATPKLF